MACPLQRILTFKEALHYGPLKILDARGVDMTQVYAYSWSTDGVCWTNWVTYKDYLELAKYVETDMYIRILVTGSIGKCFLSKG